MNVAPGQVGTIDQGASVAPGFISDAILKTGGGTLLISGNTSTARWIIDTGTLQLGNTTGATGSINYSTPNFPGMTINSGATLAKNTFDGLQHAGTILMAGGTLQLNSSDSMGTLALTANTQSIITAGSSRDIRGNRAAARRGDFVHCSRARQHDADSIHRRPWRIAARGRRRRSGHTEHQHPCPRDCLRHHHHPDLQPMIQPSAFASLLPASIRRPSPPAQARSITRRSTPAP